MEQVSNVIVRCFFSLAPHFCVLVSTQNCPEVIKHDFSPVAPSFFLLLLPLSFSPSFPHWNRWRFMLGTIRTIQRQAGQALPTCAQPNHNLMNTLGAVCSKLLPVGARATGNPPPLPFAITFCPFPSTSPPFPLPTRPSKYWLQCLDPQLWLLIKSRSISLCCQHSSTAHGDWVCSDKHISYMWGDMDWQLTCLCVGAELVLFDMSRRAAFPYVYGELWFYYYITHLLSQLCTHIYMHIQTPDVTLKALVNVVWC